MKIHTLVLLFVVGLLGSCNRQQKVSTTNQINPVIGDISYEKKFGCLPDKNTDETVRIQTHLEYVEQLLRNKDVSGLPIAEREKRVNLINLLHEYYVAAKFPANYDHPEERKPCFIDKTGNICAVGYLVEKTAGRSIAEKINREHQYDKIADMKTAELIAWVDHSGLTKEECAIIQPTYGSPNANYISPANGIASSAWCGLNVSLSTAGAIQMLNGSTVKTLAVLGILSGAGQVIYGISTVPKDTQGWGYTASNNAQKTLSFIDVGVGTTTMLLNAFNCFSHKQHKSKNNLSVSGFPVKDNQTGVAFTFVRKL